MAEKSWLANVGRSVADAVRVDSWFNAISGVGASLSRAMFKFAVNENEYLGLQDHEALYNFDGVAARICDAVPKHALRQGFTVSTGVSQVETALLKQLVALEAVPFLKRGWTWGRCYGGGAVYVGVNDGRPPWEPLDEQALRSVDWLKDVDRRDLFPETYERDSDSPRFGQPLLYTLTRIGGTATQTLTVHHSRLIRFEGLVPTNRRRLTLQGWGESVLQRCYQELQAMRGAFAASGELVQQASQGVIKMKGLADAISADTDKMVRRRLHLMDISRSVARSILLDADAEGYERVECGSLTGVADIMDRHVNLLSAVSGIPVTVLMGKAPAGLNATGDSDIRNWYDDLKAEQTSVLEPAATRLVRLLLLARSGPTQGQEPEGWHVVIPPLWQPTPTEEIDMRGKQQAIDCGYVSAGVLKPEEVAKSRFRLEGYSHDTSIDLDVRDAVLEADKTNPDVDATAIETDAAGAAEHTDTVAGIISRVAGREIPRDAGLALLEHALRLDPATADRVMGEAGRSFWTKPDPASVAELDGLREEHTKLVASHRGVRQYLARVLEKNRKGELVTGSLIAAAPTDLVEGKPLEEGDVVAVEDGAGVKEDDAGHPGLVRKEIEVHTAHGTVKQHRWVKPDEEHAKNVEEHKAKGNKTGGAPGSQFTPEAQTHFKTLGIKKLPPASVPPSKVKIDDSPPIDSHAVLSWRDAKGKVQSEYTAAFHAQNAAKKFARVKKLRPKMEKLEGELLDKAKGGSDPHAIALVLAHTGLRVGGDESLARGHYGVTTIEARHVTINPDGTADLKFIGKAGHENVAHVEDKHLAEILRKHVEGKEPTARVFDASAPDVRKALPSGIHPKDFRTVMATRTAETALTQYKPPPPLTGDAKVDMRNVLLAVKNASDKTAKALNNTPAVARKAYIPPETFSDWAAKVGVPPEWVKK